MKGTRRKISHRPLDKCDGYKSLVKQSSSSPFKVLSAATSIFITCYFSENIRLKIVEHWRKTGIIGKLFHELKELYKTANPIILLERLLFHYCFNEILKKPLHFYQLPCGRERYMAVIQVSMNTWHGRYN